MRFILIAILFLISNLSFTQDSKGFIMKGDTLLYVRAAGDTIQINRNVPPMAGQSGKVLSNNGVNYTWVVNSASVSWGGITGTLSDQTDLQSALDGKLATNGNGSSLTGLTKAQVGLSNVDNTSDADKPVSTATQSALDAKQATLSSGTNIKTINGSSVLGSGDMVITGYTLSVQALTSSPADAATIYFGQLPKAPVTAAATSKIYIRKSGTIKMAQIYCYSGTAGTSEAWVMSIRLNNTTDTQIASVASATSERIFTNSSLNIAVSAGDYIEIKCVNPTWATNPLTTIFGGYIYIE